MPDQNRQLHKLIFFWFAFDFFSLMLFCYKVDLLKNKFKFNEAFNYKEEPDLDATLKRLV